MSKKKWFVPVEWTELGLVTIEAETLNEAINIAQNEGIGLPENSSYKEDSFKLSTEDIDEIRNEYN